MKSKRPLVVLTEEGDLPSASGFDAITAETYLAGTGRAAERGAVVVNLCRSLRANSRGYYVSLLADARGQKALPSVDTLRALEDPYAVFRALQEAGVATVDREEMRGRRRSLPSAIVAPVGSGTTSTALVREDSKGTPVYRRARASDVAETLVLCGRSVDERFRRQASAVYREWPAPALRLRLLRDDGEWKVTQVALVAPKRFAGADRKRLVEELSSGRFLSKWWTSDTGVVRASIAVLLDGGDLRNASTPETIDKLARIAARRDVHVRTIGLRDLERVGDYDALFIRAFTGAAEPAFQFALRAEALGIPVTDDPQSILRSGNKVFLHELLTRADIPTPRTQVVSETSRFEDVAKLGLPFVLKLPHGAFSMAVHRIESAADFARHAKHLFQESPLLIAQEYLPTDFDWRVTVLDGKALFTCRYHMARGHWQIRSDDGSRVRYGRVEAVPRDFAPREVVKLAQRAASRIGEGIYGVDLKETRRGAVVIEVNDNPNLDIGYDDAADGDRVYEDIIDFFLRRIEAAPKPAKAPRPHRRDSAAAAPIGRPPKARNSRYRAFEVCGLELEYPVVDRDLNVVARVEDLFREIHGSPTSDVTLGRVGFSNELVDHVLEVKTPLPTTTLTQSEELLVAGVRRAHTVLQERFEARLLPTGMHPWLLPSKTRLWRRAGHRIYSAYSEVFGTESHGWRNVQSCHVNLPFGRESDAIALHDATILLIPYLPALAASSPLVEGELGESVDNRLRFVRTLQSRIPESMGEFLPESVASFREYRERILKPMIAAADRIPEASAIRSEFLNARAAILRFDREALEVRVLDTQECVKLDVAIAVFVRSALKALAAKLGKGRLPMPERSLLLADLDATIREGSAASVAAPHLGLGGQSTARHALRALLEYAEAGCRREDRGYLDLVEKMIESGSLSERIRAALAPFVDESDPAFTDRARRIYVELADCLVANEAWAGRDL